MTLDMCDDLMLLMLVPRVEWPIAVERLVALGLTAHLPAFGHLRSEQTAGIDRVLAQFDLADRRHQPATTLSGGELARAMLARALVAEPAVLIADEPLAGLDPRHARDGLERLQAVARAGTLVVVSLHDLTLAARYADRIILLKGGAVIRSGTPIDCLTTASIAEVFQVSARLSDMASAWVNIDLSPLRP